MTKISALPVAVAPVGGETLPVVQAGQMRRMPFADLQDFILSSPQADSLRTALLAGISNIGARFDNAMMQATKGLLFDFAKASFRVGTAASSTVEGTGALTTHRSSSALALNAEGVYQSFAADTLRVTSRGVLIEGEATNLLPQPVDMSGAVPWPANGMGASLVAGAGPDGVSNAYDLTETASNAAGAANKRAFFMPTAGVYTFSIHLKRGGRRYTQVQISGGSTHLFVLDFDAKTFTSVAGITLPLAASVTELANGWFRVSITAQLTAVSTNLTIHGASGITSADRTYATVQGTIACRAAMAQVEAGATLTSPILTGGGVRGADVVKIAVPEGAKTDLVTIQHSDGVANLLRGLLANPGEVDLVADGDHSWLGRYITTISLVPAFDTKLIEATPSGAQPYLVAMNGTFYWNGAAHAAEGEMIATLGGAGGMGTLQFGGYVAPDAPNLLGAADFAVDQQGFVTASAVTGSVAGSTEGGYLKMVSAAGSQYSALSRKLFGYAGKALRFTATVKTAGVDGSGVQLGIAYYGPSFQTSWASAVTLRGDTVDTALSVIGSPGPGSPFYVGLKQLTGGGTTLLKNPKLVEMSAAKNFPSGNAMIEVSGITPNPLPASTQVLWQIDVGNEVDRLRIELRADGSVHLVMRVQNGASGQSWDLALGSLAAGAAFRIVAGCNASKLAGAMNGNTAQVAYPQRPVAAGYFRMGRDSAAASLFTGTINGYRIFEGLDTPGWMQRRSGVDTAADDPGIWLDGDSYTRYDTGILTNLIDAGYDVVGTGLGGSSFAQQFARLTDAANLAAYRKRTLVWWDGSQNDRVAGAVFNGTIADDVLTVSALTSGALAVDQLISGNGVAAGTFVLAQLTGAAGGVGTYRVSVSQNVAAGSISAWQEFIWYKAVVTALGHDRHLYIRSGQISTQGPGSTTLVTARGPESIDMDSIAAKIAATYGAHHVCNPQPFIATLYTGAYGTSAYKANQSDAAFGFFPRDLMMDGAHLNAATRDAVERAVIRPALEVIRAL